MEFYKIKKTTKNKCKDYITHFINTIDAFNNNRLSKKSIGEIIRAIHFATPINIIILLCVSPQYICNMIMLYILFVSTLFIIFDGCFLTMIEQYYCEDTFTIIDPPLELLNIEKTNKNRFLISIPIAIIYITIIFIIYYYRFIFYDLSTS
jgi:hypothetical protein